MTSLTALQRLKLVAWDLAAGARYGQRPAFAKGCWAFTHALTSLTSLEVTPSAVNEVCELSKCASLQHLVLQDVPGREAYGGVRVQATPCNARMTDKAWEAIAELKHLSRLELWHAMQLAPSPVFESAIRQLTGLVCVAAASWAPEALSVLQSLPHLTEIQGGWVLGQAGDALLPSVRTLSLAEGHVPFSAFPELTYLGQMGVMHVTSFGALSTSCTKLKHWSLHRLVGNTALSLDPYNHLPQNVVTGYINPPPAVKRIEAVQSLTALTRLSQLDFAPRDNAELLALSSAIGALVQHGRLKHLRVELSLTSHCSTRNLVCFGHQLLGLHELYLDLAQRPDDGYSSEGAVLLSGLSGVRKVTIASPNGYDNLLLTQTRTRMLSDGLPCPADLVVVDSDPPSFVGYSWQQEEW